MFTGLIGEVGELIARDQRGAGVRIKVRAPRAARALKLGGSVAVSGVCLTAVEIRKSDWFCADLAAETLRRTSLGKFNPGAKVNLELPLRAGEPLGGHIVQGHVDGVGKLLSLEPVFTTDGVERHRGTKASSRKTHPPEKYKAGSGWWMRIQLPKVLERYVVEKGSVTVEGISLTVARCGRGELAIAVIPHTYAATNLCALKSGDLLNIELDVVAKYADAKRAHSAAGKLTKKRLQAEGFLELGDL